VDGTLDGEAKHNYCIKVTDSQVILRTVLLLYLYVVRHSMTFDRELRELSLRAPAKSSRGRGTTRSGLEIRTFGPLVKRRLDILVNSSSRFDGQ
jgi:hypothetical protein